MRYGIVNFDDDNGVSSNLNMYSESDSSEESNGFIMVSNHFDDTDSDIEILDVQTDECPPLEVGTVKPDRIECAPPKVDLVDESANFEKITADLATSLTLTEKADKERKEFSECTPFVSRLNEYTPTVFFDDIRDSYPVRTPLIAKLRFSDGFQNHPSDTVVLLRAGWQSIGEALSVARIENESVTFYVDQLPKDSPDLYQLCYVSWKSENFDVKTVPGVSRPFGFHELHDENSTTQKTEIEDREPIEIEDSKVASMASDIFVSPPIESMYDYERRSQLRHYPMQLPVPELENEDEKPTEEQANKVKTTTEKIMEGFDKHRMHADSVEQSKRDSEDSFQWFKWKNRTPASHRDCNMREAQVTRGRYGKARQRVLMEKAWREEEIAKNTELKKRAAEHELSKSQVAELQSEHLVASLEKIWSGKEIAKKAELMKRAAERESVKSQVVDLQTDRLAASLGKMCREEEIVKKAELRERTAERESLKSQIAQLQVELASTRQFVEYMINQKDERLDLMSPREREAHLRIYDHMKSRFNQTRPACAPPQSPVAEYSPTTEAFYEAKMEQLKRKNQEALTHLQELHSLNLAAKQKAFHQQLAALEKSHKETVQEYAESLVHARYRNDMLQRSLAKMEEEYESRLKCCAKEYAKLALSKNGKHAVLNGPTNAASSAANDSYLSDLRTRWKNIKPKSKKENL